MGNIYISTTIIEVANVVAPPVLSQATTLLAYLGFTLNRINYFI